MEGIRTQIQGGLCDDTGKRHQSPNSMATQGWGDLCRGLPTGGKSSKDCFQQECIPCNMVQLQCRKLEELIWPSVAAVQVLRRVRLFATP